eukprot:GFYU01029036.1.p1 GENE.GFYU01029036.1~~GFYU01029036.1.p1  ORF type:complete len:331 (-),score=29.99 GFYU01029036.1:131-1123(-)
MNQIKTMGSMMVEIIAYLQVVSTFASYEVNWPPEIRQMFEAFSAFNVNADLLAPECSQGYSSYFSRWYIKLGMPIYAIVPFALPCLIDYATFKLRRVRGRRQEGGHHHVSPDGGRIAEGGLKESRQFDFNAWKAACVRAYTLFLAIMYLPFATVVIQPISCIQNNDGVFYMKVQRDIVCSVDNSEWVVPMVISIILMTMLALVLPLGVLYVLLRSRHQLFDPAIVARFGHFYEKCKLGLSCLDNGQVLILLSDDLSDFPPNPLRFICKNAVKTNNTDNHHDVSDTKAAHNRLQTQSTTSHSCLRGYFMDAELLCYSSPTLYGTTTLRSSC